MIYNNINHYAIWKGIFMLENLVKDFKEIFKYSGEVETFFSPGRVNLIGEHTDYNGGFVFPVKNGYSYNYKSGNSGNIILNDVYEQCPSPPVANWHTHPNRSDAEDGFQIRI